MILPIKVKPNSRINKLLRGVNGVLTIKINAPAHEGKANEAVIKFLAETFHIPKSQITIVSGFTNPNKRVSIPDEYANRIMSVKL